jgi:hypothetical protein
MRYIILAFLLTGCISKPQPPPAAPAKVENKEKDKYIEKVEAIVSDSASALTAVVPVLDKGTVREVVEAQVTRLSGVAKPSVAKTQEFQKIIATNDKKGVEKDKKEASKVDAETDALWLMVEEKDYELMEANAKADAEFKQKVLWQFSTAGLGLFTIGLLALAFSPFKKSAGIIMAGGMLAMSSAWIFDSTWFTWIVGVSIAMSVIGIAVSIYKGRKPEAKAETENPEQDKRKIVDESV